MAVGMYQILSLKIQLHQRSLRAEHICSGFPGREGVQFPHLLVKAFGIVAVIIKGDLFNIVIRKNLRRIVPAEHGFQVGEGGLVCDGLIHFDHLIKIHILERLINGMEQFVIDVQGSQRLVHHLVVVLEQGKVSEQIHQIPEPSGKIGEMVFFKEGIKISWYDIHSR